MKSFVFEAKYNPRPEDDDGSGPITIKKCVVAERKQDAEAWISKYLTPLSRNGIKLSLIVSHDVDAVVTSESLVALLKD